MNTEGLGLKFTEDGIQKIAEIAFQVNENTENIGARRLHTVMERLLETVSFDAPEQGGKTLTINEKYVLKQLAKLSKNLDLTRYIL